MKKKKDKKDKIYVSVGRMRDIDRAASEKYGIASLILMENAGRALALESLKILKKLKNKKTAVVCGSGNNAGDGFVAARYLINKGVETKVILAKKADLFEGDCKVNFAILQKLKADISYSPDFIGESGLVIDALLGTGLDGDVRKETAEVIKKINVSKAYVISADIPSGLDGDGGDCKGCAVKADKTVAFAFLKLAFKNKSAKKYTGTIITADIGIPAAAVKDMVENEKVQN